MGLWWMGGCRISDGEPCKADRTSIELVKSFKEHQQECTIMVQCSGWSNSKIVSDGSVYLYGANWSGNV